MLELRIGQAVEEFAKPIYLVALGDDDEDRKSDIQNTLNYIQLLGNFARFLLNCVRRILNQAVGRDYEEQAIYRAVGTVLLQESEELFPFACLTGLNVLEHQTTCCVEKDCVVGEPPIHVDRSADTLKLVLHSGRKSDVAMTNRFGFTGPRLTDDNVPGQLVVPRDL